MPTYAPVTDRAGTHAELAEIARLTAALDQPGVAARLEDLSLTHPQDFWDGCWAVAGAAGADALLDAWRRQDPDDPTLGLLSGTRGIRAAWDVRSSYSAEHVSREQFRRFHETLRRTERGLLELCAVEPGLAEPWALRLTTNLGLELGESESARRYARLSAIDPHHLGAQQVRLQQLCPKWSAPDFTGAESFVRSCTQSGPPELGVDGLWAALVLEEWHHRGGSDEVLTGPLRAELDGASDRLLGTRLSGRFTGWSVHTAFAVVHSLCGDRDRAAAHLARLGTGLDESTLGYLGQRPRDELMRLRQRVLDGRGPR